MADPESAPQASPGGDDAPPAGERLEASLSHLRPGPGGAEAQMVDVSGKSSTRRHALARARVRFPSGRLAEVLAGAGPKGPVQEVARVAGIQAAKRTGELIPMCHPLALDHVEVQFVQSSEDVLEVRCRATCEGPTGVEMEAMTGAALAALVLYDMTKAIDKGIRIEALELLEKSGGRSGSWRAPGPEAAG